MGWNKDNIVLCARKHCPVRCFLIFPSVLSSWLVSPNLLALFPCLPRGSRMRCMHDREVRGCEDMASWQHPAQSQAQARSCNSTAMGDHGSHRAFSQAPWVVAWESNAAFICWEGSGRAGVLSYWFLDFSFYFLDCFRGRMCFSSKLFSLIGSSLGFSWWKWLRWRMCTELVPEGVVSLLTWASSFINPAVSHSDRPGS